MKGEKNGLKFINFFMKSGVLLCVQSRQICSAGDSPVRVKARNFVAWIAGIRETEITEAY